MWPFILSDRLCIIALVGRYLTNKLIQRKPIPQRCKRTFNSQEMPPDYLCGINSRFQLLSPALGQVAYVLLTRSPLTQPNSKLSSNQRNTPFDLHVLGTPPAFVLSQDQTLHNNYRKPIRLFLLFRNF